MIPLNLLSAGFKAAAEIYKNRQATKIAMSEAALNQAQKMKAGELEYQGKLLEARQTDWKDEFVLIVISIPVFVLGYAVFADDIEIQNKLKLFFEYFNQFPLWFQGLWISVVAAIYGIKGTEIMRKGKSD